MNAEEQEAAVLDIQKWLRQENVTNARQDKDSILRFLRGCKNKVEKAKTKMKNFYEVRRKTPEIFQGRDPLLKNVEALLASGAFFPLPVKPDTGYVLVMVKAGANDPRTIPMMDVFKVGVMSVDLLLESDDDLTKNGVHLIVDLSGVGLHHALQMTPTLLKKMVYLWQDCYPIRIKGIDFVNCPTSVDLVLNILRRFLRENLKQRLRTHGCQLETFHEIVDPKLLPKEYGGTLGPEADIITEWQRKVTTHRDWFLNDDTLK